MSDVARKCDEALLSAVKGAEYNASNMPGGFSGTAVRISEAYEAEAKILEALRPFVAAALVFLPHIIPPDRPRNDEEFEAAMIRSRDVPRHRQELVDAYRALVKHVGGTEEGVRE